MTALAYMCVCARVCVKCVQVHSHVCACVHVHMQRLLFD